MENQATKQVVPTVDANDMQQIIPFNAENVLANYTEEERVKVLALSDQITLTASDNIMHYGSRAIEMTLRQASQFLKGERGSSADREIMKSVQEYSEKAQAGYDNFQIAIREPNPLIKKITSVVPALQHKRDKKIAKAVMSASDLIESFKNACDTWLDSLRKAAADIEKSGESDVNAARLLEKYIIAGELAKERLSTDVEEARQRYEATGSVIDAKAYHELDDNYRLFVVRLENLKQSRVMHEVSVGQLILIRRGNRDMQAALETQRDSSMSLMSQQMRNGILSYKTHEVRSGQQAIGALNNAILKDITIRASETAEGANKQLYAGVCDIETAKEAITTFVRSFDTIQKQAEEMLPVLERNTAELTKLAKSIKESLNGADALAVEHIESESSPVNMSMQEANEPVKKIAIPDDSDLNF